MMYMPDAVRAAMELMEADPDGLEHRNAFNVTAMQLTPATLASAIAGHIPDFTIDYDVDPDTPGHRRLVAGPPRRQRRPRRSGAGGTNGHGRHGGRHAGPACAASWASANRRRTDMPLGRLAGALDAHVADLEERGTAKGADIVVTGSSAPRAGAARASGWRARATGSSSA
jgi:hypothetical protein